MPLTIWTRVRARHKRVLNEVLQMQRDMARENRRAPMPILSNTRATPLIAIVFSVLLILVGIGCWMLIHP